MLPADKKHPPRPDLPILRHLTYVEAHAFELGVYFSAILAVGFHVGEVAATFGLMVFVVRKLVSNQKARHDPSAPDEPISLRDAKEELPYFGTGAILVALAYWALLLL